MRFLHVFILCRVLLSIETREISTSSGNGLVTSQDDFSDVYNSLTPAANSDAVHVASKKNSDDMNFTRYRSVTSILKMNRFTKDRVKFKTEQKANALNTPKINSNKKESSRSRILKSRVEESMTKHHIRNTSVTCNDGSTPGYYLRKSDVSSRWIIFLEGGWLCFDDSSCFKRWFETSKFMTSQNLPNAMKGTGILSTNKQENAFIFNGNHVFVPYCSSDSWSGSFKASDRDAFSFMGSNIVEEVVRDLIEVHKMTEGKQVHDTLSSSLENILIYLAGSSAGGTGVLLNIDRVSRIIHELRSRDSLKHKHRIVVRGISDSGWFIDNSQFRQTVCTGLQHCSPLEIIKKAMPMWKAVVPPGCFGAHESESWKCYFGQYVYPTLTTEVLVVQNLYDGAQLVANNVGSPVDSEQWNFIKDVGTETRATLSHVRYLFAPGCLLHVLLTRSDWATIKIKNISLPSQLQCWEKQELSKLKSITSSDAMSMLKKSNSVQSNLKSASSLKMSKLNNLQLKNKPANRRKRLSEIEKKQKNKDPKKAKCERLRANFSRQIDSCRWPHCNLSCPKLRDPYSGREIDLISILSQFDLDLNTVADVLGVKLAYLRSMNQKELMKLLVTSGDER